VRIRRSGRFLSKKRQWGVTLLADAAMHARFAQRHSPNFVWDHPGSVGNYDKVRQSVTSKSKSKKHGPITGSDLGRNGLIRACDWSMLSAFAFALQH